MLCLVLTRNKTAFVDLVYTTNEPLLELVWIKIKTVVAEDVPEKNMMVNPEYKLCD